MAAHVKNGMSTDGPALKSIGARLKALILAGTTPTNTDVRDAINNSGLSISPNVAIHVHQNTANELHVALPSKDQLEAILAKINAGNYMLNIEFDAFADNPAPSLDETLDFYDFRLGDYVLQHCD